MSMQPTAPPPVYVPRAQYTAPPVERWVWIGSIVLVLALTAMCVPLVRMFMARTHDGEQVADALHKEMRAHDLAGIYNDSDPDFQNDPGRQGSDKLFQTVHDRLGDPRSSKWLASKTSQTSKYGELLMLRLRTQFDKGPGTEDITLHRVNGRYRIIGYHVYSPLFRNTKTAPSKSN